MPESLDLAARIETIQSTPQFNSQMACLQRVESQIAAERAFFTNPAAEFDRCYRDRGLDPLLLAILKRDFDERTQAVTPAYARIFDELSHNLDQARAFLVKMDGYRGNWNFNPDTRQIQFNDWDTRRAYQAGSSAFEQGAKSVQTALRALADFQPAKGTVR